MKRTIAWLTITAAILAIGCMQRKRPAATTPSLSLTGREWTLISLHGNNITAQRPPSLRFEDGRVTGFGGINRLSSSYSSDGANLKFGQTITTRMAGDPALMELERNFLNALGVVDGFRIERDELRLNRRDTIVATLRPAKPAAETPAKSG